MPAVLHKVLIAKPRRRRTPAVGECDKQSSEIRPTDRPLRRLVSAVRVMPPPAQSSFTVQAPLICKGSGRARAGRAADGDLSVPRAEAGMRLFIESLRFRTCKFKVPSGHLRIFVLRDPEVPMLDACVAAPGAFAPAFGRDGCWVRVVPSADLG